MLWHKLLKKVLLFFLGEMETGLHLPGKVHQTVSFSSPDYFLFFLIRVGALCGS